MRHQPRHAPVAVQERVYPQQPVVRCRRRDDGLCLAEAAIGSFELIQETGQGAGADRDVLPDPHIPGPQSSRDHVHPLTAVGIFDPEQRIGQQLTESPVDLADSLRGERTVLQPAAVDPALDRDVCPGFKLEVALFSVCAVVLVQRALDIHRVGVMPLDQVAVVTVHRPHEVGERGEDALGQAAPKPGRMGGELDRQIGEPRTVTRGL